MQIRKATKNDMSAVLGLIQELANYEKAPNEVEVTVQELQMDGFGDQKLFDCLVAEDKGVVVGMALYYNRYSTWKGKTIYLEDLVISQERRREGIGTLLFEELLRICKIEHVKRFEWQVLDWNEPAIEFYKKYNTKFDHEWVNCQLVYSQIKER